MDKKLLQEISHQFNYLDFRENLRLEDARIDEFLSWFDQNANGFSLSEVMPHDSLGEQFRLNRCFGNSQVYAHQAGLPYYEGFVKFGGNFIQHGFVLLDGCALDVTYLNHPNDFAERWPPGSDYWGIEIPQEILGGQIENFEYKAYNDPQLLNLFRYIKGK